MEKAELKEKDRLKEEARKQKRLESNFRQLLKSKFDSLTEQSKWEDVKGQIENENDYLALSSETDRVRLFEEYHKQVVADAQAAAAAAAAAAAHHSHHHHKKARKEKKKRKHEKSNSSNTAPVRREIREGENFFIEHCRNPMVKRRRNRAHQQHHRHHRHRLMFKRVMKVKRKIVMAVDHRRPRLHLNRPRPEPNRKRVKNPRRNERRKLLLVIHRFVSSPPICLLFAVVLFLSF